MKEVIPLIDFILKYWIQELFALVIAIITWLWRALLRRKQENEQIREGMKLRVGSEEAVIASTKEDSYGRITGVAEISLPDGSYNGIVVVDETKPISFLLESR